MKIRHARLIIEDADGVHRHATMDVIEYANAFWLVPEWLENHVQKRRKPLRIISLTAMEHQRTKGNGPEFLVSMPVPMCVFEGQIPPGTESRYVVVEEPEIDIPLGPTHH